MSWSENRREYLDKKYEEYDDESNTSYHKGSQRKTPKKANHKHDYQNCVLIYKEKMPDYRSPDGFSMRDFHMLGSYCPLCGKIGQFNTSLDTRDWYYRAHSSIHTENHMSFDDMYAKYMKVLPVFEIPQWDCKYVSR